METIKVEKYISEIPKGFTGIAECHNGSKVWFVDSKRHRIDGPAIERHDGSKIWYLNDKCHRVDGPAWEYADGSKEWYMDGKLHRVDGPAVEWSDGTKEWCLNGSFVYALRKPIVDYIVIEEGLPSTMKWLGKRVPTLKVLTATGIKFIPNLPGI